ncbi:MAG: AAA family ATPase [bacterium]
MPEAQSVDPIKFITCADCQGSGRQRLMPCRSCRGFGFGAFHVGQFYYFSYQVNQGTIMLDKLQKLVNKILDIVVYLIGICGLLALVWWVYQNSLRVVDLSDFFFWQEKSWLLSVFWLSLLADMFVIYRLQEKSAQQQKIPKLKATPANILPNKWEELKKIRKINVIDGSNEQTLDLLANCHQLAVKFKHAPAKALHLFGALITGSGEVNALLQRLNVDVHVLGSKVGGQLLKLSQSNQGPQFSQEIKEIFIRAYITAQEQGQWQLEPLALLWPTYQQEKLVSEILYDLEVDADMIKNVVAWFDINDKLIANYRLYRKMARFKPSTNMDRAYTALATPLLNSFAYDLTLAAKYGKLDLCVGRDHELGEVFSALESGNYGILLVGGEGVGKTTLVGGLAQAMVTENVPKILRDKRLLEVDVAQLIGGANPAQAQERLLAIANEVARAKNIILYFKDLENIAGITSGTEESLDLSEILANALERHSLLVVASVTDVNYTKYLEGKPLDSAMAKVKLIEPDINPAIQMIESKTALLEGQYNVYFTYNAVASAVKLSSRYLHDQRLPDKAIKILEEVAVRVNKNKSDKAVVTKDDVAQLISDKTKVPVTKVGQEESEQLLNLEDRIHERMVNQAEAVKMVAASLRRARVQLRAGKRPIANFLFLGPTGVGKTELAKTVAAIYFGQEEYMIRVDMSEYQQADSVNKMIGDVDNKGYLTELVRKNPFALVLLDEIEKAHPDILNLFLQVMDDGRLTDGQGRTIDFTNSIIIATSNIGSLYIQQAVKQNTDIKIIRQKLVDEELSQKMRPELINRFDGIVVFTPLSMEHVVQITKLMFKNTAVLLEAKGVALQVTDQGAAVLAQAGYQPEFGARPLRRLLQDRIEDVIASKLLAGEIARRDTVKINEQGEVEIIKGQVL